MILRVEEESAATRQAIEELKEEVYRQREIVMQRVDYLESKISTLETKHEELSTRTYAILQNICSSLLNPQGSKGASWKAYWSEQVRALKEYRSSDSPPISIPTTT